MSEVASRVELPGRVAASPGLAGARSFLDRALSTARRKPLGALGLFVVLTLVAVAVLAPIIAPFDPNSQHVDDALLPPGSVYLLGTDNFGRDVLSRLIWGTRISLYVGMMAVGLGTLCGALWGLISGYAGGRTDYVMQRLMETLQSFPLLVLAMAVVAALGPSTTNVMLAVALVLMPGANRVVRGSVLAIKETPFTEAARCIGCSPPRIIFRHVLVNALAPVIVLATITLGNAILVEANLSFLGLGPPPPAATWGSMLSVEGRSYFERAPWLAIFPGLAISLAVLGFNILGDAVRDLWDPRLRGAKR